MPLTLDFQGASHSYHTYARTPDAQRVFVIRLVDDDRRPLALMRNWTTAALTT